MLLMVVLKVSRAAFRAFVSAVSMGVSGSSRRRLLDTRGVPPADREERPHKTLQRNVVNHLKTYNPELNKHKTYINYWK